MYNQYPTSYITITNFQVQLSIPTTVTGQAGPGILPCERFLLLGYVTRKAWICANPGSMVCLRNLEIALIYILTQSTRVSRIMLNEGTVLTTLEPGRAVKRTNRYVEITCQSVQSGLQPIWAFQDGKLIVW